MLPKKKLKTKNPNKANKVAISLKTGLATKNVSLKKVSSSPNKMGKKANLAYTSSRKDIPSAKITLT